MIDIHAHILPGIDDGPGSLDEAVLLCRQAASIGISTIIATPHQNHEVWDNYDHELLRERLEILRAALGPLPRLLLGAEVAANDRFYDALAAGRLLNLGDSDRLLLEFDWIGLGPAPEDLVHEVTVTGRIPVVAHVERFSWLLGDVERVARLTRLGAEIQVNADSLLPHAPRAVRLFARHLIEADLVNYVASDMHNLVSRPPSLDRAYQVLSEWLGEGRARDLCGARAAATIVRGVEG